MTSDFAAAMRRATDLTRGFNLTEATSAIQQALGGRPAAIEPSELVDVTPKPAEPAPLPPNLSMLGERILKPLSEVVQTLRKGRASVLDTPRARRPAAPVPTGAQFLARDFSCPAGSRAYKLFIPAGGAKPPRGLIVMLHGCQQNADDFATGTKMNELAATHNLVVAYPSQTSSANAGNCWNWFEPGHQMRDRGEPAILAGITRQLMQEFKLQRAQVFVAGLSAGGAMAAVLAETYPDLYAASGIHSGLAYRSANDVMSAFSTMQGDASVGSSVRRPRPEPNVRAIIFHGEADRTVSPSNGRRLVGTFAVPGSSPTIATGVSGSGRSFSREVYKGASADSDLEFWSIAGAGHAWSGGSAQGSYTDPTGPDASKEMIRFFLG